jgi:hypothetical protein
MKEKIKKKKSVLQNGLRIGTILRAQLKSIIVTTIKKPTNLID